LTESIAIATTRRAARPAKDRTVNGEFAAAAARVREFAAVMQWPNPRYADDPVGFARDVLGVEPWAKQIEILEAVRDHGRVSVVSGHKVSKSHSAAILAIWWFATRSDARVCMTSVTSRQVDAILWREVRKLLSKARHRIDGDVHELARSGLKASDFREIVGFTAKEAEAVAGISGANLLYILDEASGIPSAIFEAIEGNRAGGARLVMFSNPTRTTGEFFDSHHSKKALYRCIHVSSADTPNVIEGRVVIPGLATRAWVDEKRIEWGEDSPLFKVRVLGQFVRNEEGRILSLHALTESSTRWYETPATGRLYIGLDPAGDGVGGDESVFAARRGRKQLLQRAFRGASTDALIAHLEDLIVELRLPRERPVVVIDSEGKVGWDLLCALRSYLESDSRKVDFELVRVRSSEKAKRQPHVYRLWRDELWGNLAAWIRDGGAILEDDKLTQELHEPEWLTPPDGGKQYVTKKDDLRVKLGRSPDRADALSLSVWEPAALAEEDAPEATVVAAPTRARRDEDDFAEATHDPYSGLNPWGRS
jgi:phage terminase large subunit